MLRRIALGSHRGGQLRGPIDINLASAEQLRGVPGVGPRTVDRLLAIRQTRRLRLRDLQRLNVGLSRAKPFVITADYRPAAVTGDSLSSFCRGPERRQLPLF